MDGLVEHRHGLWDQVNLDLDTTWLLPFSGSNVQPQSIK